MQTTVLDLNVPKTRAQAKRLTAGKEGELLKAINDNKVHFAAGVVSGDTLLGWGCIYGSENMSCMLTCPPMLGIFVDKQHRRKGIGTSIVQALVNKKTRKEMVC
jgi:GNAT superfamily N-acetyltransferase